MTNQPEDHVHAIMKAVCELPAAAEMIGADEDNIVCITLEQLSGILRDHLGEPPRAALSSPSQQEEKNDLGGHVSHGGRDDLEPAAPATASHDASCQCMTCMASGRDVVLDAASHDPQVSSPSHDWQPMKTDEKNDGAGES